MVSVTPPEGAVALVALGALALLLAAVEVRRAKGPLARAHTAWAVGLGLVALTLVQEAAFFVGYAPEGLVRSYLWLVAILVGILSLGSAQLWASARARLVYAGFVGAASVAAAVACALVPLLPGLLVDGVVSGPLPLAILLASSALTFPGAGVMILGSVRGALRSRRWRLLYIAAGVVVISAAGGLYLASVPITLYFAEFAGVALLFLGFGVTAPRPAGVGAAAARPREA